MNLLRFPSKYLLKIEIGPECLDEFALNNVSYHVWSYWRGLFSDLVITCGLA